MNKAAKNPRFSEPRASTVVAAVLSFFLASSPISAKRPAPKPVLPVVVNSVEYSAPPKTMGFVIATDTRSRKGLWRERIYVVRFNPLLERDVQDVFIASLSIERGKLIVINERGNSYAVDLATRLVTKRK